MGHEVALSSEGCREMVNMVSCLQGHIAQRERCSHLGTGEVLSREEEVASGEQKEAQAISWSKSMGRRKMWYRLEKGLGVNDRRGDSARP